MNGQICLSQNLLEKQPTEKCGKTLVEARQCTYGPMAMDLDDDDELKTLFILINEILNFLSLYFSLVPFIVLL